LVLSDHCDFHYKVSRLHDPVAERALLWNDPTLAINWPLASGAEPLLSERDLNAPGFAACEKYP
jgi:dTDP-4-dehydrorhamnose 3,5-epimerase